MRVFLNPLTVIILVLSFNLISCNTDNEITSDTKDEIEREIDNALQEVSKYEKNQHIKNDNTVVDTNISLADTEVSKVENTTIDEKISEVMQNTAEDSPPLAHGGNAKKGEELFMNTCASCHGIQGVGDGVAAVSLDPKPRDLSDRNYVSAISDNHLFRVISLGGVSVGKSALMPPWGGILSEEEIWHIITHIRKNICECSYVESAEETDESLN